METFLFEGLRLFYDSLPAIHQLPLVPARRHFDSKLKCDLADLRLIF
jgi:hypothetical protein